MMKNNFDHQDELNFEFSWLFNLLKREKKLVVITTAITTLLSIIFYINIKPIWRGGFQIVVNNKPNTLNSLSNEGVTTSALLNLGNLTGIKQDRRTQEYILKSPSVLLPVYEFAKNYSKKNNLKFEAKSYKEWLREDLSIGFEKNTNVLGINIKNRDKKLIFKTLEMISKKYQNFAKENKDKSISQTIDYLTKQKELLSIKLNKSLKEFNDYAINNGMSSVDGFVEIGELGENNNVSIFNRNNINELSTLINNNKNIQKDSLSSSSGQRFRNQFYLLERYETEYIDYLSKLKPNSKYMTNLKLKIDNLRSSLKRPNEILLKFRELKNIARRDEKILSQVSLNLESMKLSKAQQPYPWELISKPQIEGKKLYPRLRYLAGFIFVSSLIGNITALFIKLKTQRKIYDKDLLISLINTKFLETIYINDIELTNQIIQSFLEDKQEPSNKISSNGFIFIEENFNTNEINQKKLNLEEKNFKLLSIKDKSKIEKIDNIYLVITLGEIKNTDIEILNKYILIYRSKVVGWFLLENND